MSLGGYSLHLPIFVVSAFSLASAISAATITLSGTVIDSATQRGISNVMVSLAKGGLSTTTLSDGSWTLNGAATGIAGCHGTAAVSGASHLSVQDGHMILRFEGYDLLGHSQHGTTVAVEASSSAALARGSSSALDTIDTLLFSWQQGTVHYHEPITSYVQSGITTVLDTMNTSSAVTGNSGTFTDSRDGQTYQYVRIGGQRWMAQNLNYQVDRSWCYDDSLANCTKYGRLYQWTAAMGLDTSYNHKLWQGADSARHQGICPSGWHVPSDAEWSTLIQYVESAISGMSLRSTSGCSDSFSLGNGQNTYGFSILPSGVRNSIDGTFFFLGDDTYFWSSSEYDASNAWFRLSSCEAYDVQSGYGYKSLGFSLRCIRN